MAVDERQHVLRTRYRHCTRQQNHATEHAASVVCCLREMFAQISDCAQNRRGSDTMDRAVHANTLAHSLECFSHTHTSGNLFDTLHHSRFQKNAEDALLHHDILPPGKQSALDKVKASAAKVTNVTFSDVRPCSSVLQWQRSL